MSVISIVVLYKCKVSEAKTLNSFLEIDKMNPDTFSDNKLIIYDNGPVNQENDIFLPMSYQYIFDEKNSGLAKAYNFALKIANDESYKWLQLLDQDTILPSDYFDVLNQSITSFGDSYNIVAFVPKVYSKNVFFSPSRIYLGEVHRPIKENHSGICDCEVTSIGSGSTVNVCFLNRINGFNEFFWLDSLDRWLYKAISDKKGKVFVFNTKIDHELSVSDYDEYMSITRYNNILFYETAFVKKYTSRFNNQIYFLRLVFRAIKFVFNKHKREYFISTIIFICKNIVSIRAIVKFNSKVVKYLKKAKITVVKEKIDSHE